ncbi:MAG TPA: PEP-CTERM sorting domain-containing protein [Planctomycetaceae bacterium]|nr:PEP-CTERM sorting domain-containing protein [Planctomycetaceae bacterium]
MLLEDTGGNSVTIEDNGPGDMNDTIGVIVFDGTLGGDTTWTINVATGLSKPILGPDADMDLNSVNVATDGPGTLRISLTDTDYTSVANTSFGVQFEIGGTNSSQGILLAQFWGDDSNSEFGMSELLGTLGPFGDGAFSDTGNAVWSSQDGVFSLTQRITLVHNASGRSSFNVNLTALGNPDLQEIVPEPASMSIMFLGTLLAGFGLRRRKENQIGLN